MLLSKIFRVVNLYPEKPYAGKMLTVLVFSAAVTVGRESATVPVMPQRVYGEDTALYLPGSAGALSTAPATLFYLQVRCRLKELLASPLKKENIIVLRLFNLITFP